MEIDHHFEAAHRRGGARHAGQPQQRVCGSHEWIAATGQACCQRFQNRIALHRYRVFAYVQTQAFAIQPIAAGLASGRRANPQVPVMSSSNDSLMDFYGNFNF